MTVTERIPELQEKRAEFILNESVFADDHPSWGEVAEAQAEAESRWNETDEGKELKALPTVDSNGLCLECGRQYYDIKDCACPDSDCPSKGIKS